MTDTHCHDELFLRLDVHMSKITVKIRFARNLCNTSHSWDDVSSGPKCEGEKAEGDRLLTFPCGLKPCEFANQPQRIRVGGQKGRKTREEGNSLEKQDWEECHAEE